MAKKSTYKRVKSKNSHMKVLAGTLTNFYFLKEDIYEALSSITPAEIQARISEIDNEMQGILKEMLNRQAKIRDGIDPKHRADEMGEGINTQALEDLTEVMKILEKEKKMLEQFPKVQKKLKLIANIQTRMVARKAKKLEEAKAKLELAEKQAEKLKKKIDEIDEEIAEAEDTMKALDGKKTKVAEKARATIQAEIDELKGKKDQVGKLDNIQEEIDKAQAEVNTYTSGMSLEDGIINQCKMPWYSILAGKSWKDISLMTEEELNKKLGVPKKEKEEKSKDKDKDDGSEGKDDKDKDKYGKDNKDKKGKDTKSMPRGGDTYIPPAPAPEPEPEPEPESKPDLEPDDPVEPDDKKDKDEPLPMKLWSERNSKIAKWLPFLAKWMDKREINKLSKQARKELAKAREEALIKKFHEENKGEPGLLDKLAARYPRLAKFLGKDKDDGNNPPAPPIGGKTEAPQPTQAEPTPEPAEPVSAETEPELAELISEKEKRIKEREEILKEVTKLSLKEIQARKADWEGKFTEKEIAMFEKTASTREEHARKQAEKLRAEAERKDAFSKPADITYRGRREAFRAEQQKGVKVEVVQSTDSKGGSAPALVPADGPAMPPQEDGR